MIPKRFSALALAVVLGSAAATTPAIAQQGFDWNGFYVGIFKGAEMLDVPGDRQVVFGKLIGVNLAVSDIFVLGVETRVGAEFLEGSGYFNTELFGMARAGVLITDDLLLYATAGYGIAVYDIGYNQISSFGGGIEWAARDDFSVRGEIVARECQGGTVLCLAGPYAHFDISAIWHMN